MRSEPGDADRGDPDQAEHAGQRDAPSLPGGALSQHEERQHEAGCELDPHAAGESERRGPWAGGRVRPRGAQQQSQAERQQQQGVVVGTADGEHEQDRVQPQQRQREGPRAAEPSCGFGREPDRPEAAQHRQRLQRPQPARHPQRGGGVAREREQRPVGRMLERPADESEDGIGRRFGREVRVGVQAVQRPHAAEGQIAEDVLGDQRRTEEQDHVRRDHGRRERAQREGARRRERDEVASAHHQHERLEAALPERRAEPAQWPGQPPGPAAAVRRHVLRGSGGGVHAEDRERRQQRQQREPACDSKRTRRGGIAARVQPRCGGPGSNRRALGALEDPGSGRRRSARGLHMVILTALRPSGIHAARYAVGEPRAGDARQQRPVRTL